ncbi:MAG TPA: peptidoglycan DD-metalloendopeptidase family protein [Arachnia sp.]|nr:peptidoglycan DD-metalloendopeptidase family protein [Arachnia sp.]HMT87139.1 peptidoglycan DD-metalloendopeptidase family protein [Arachnia sp.]
MKKATETRVGRLDRLRTSLAAAGLALVLFGVSSPAALADDLDVRRDQLKGEIAEQAAVVDEASAEFDAAVAARDNAERELKDAQSELRRAEDKLAEAERLHRQRVEELAAAERALVKAKAEVAAAEKALQELNARIDGEIMVITQQNAPLLNLALLLTDVSAAQLNQRAQLGQTIFDSSALELDELERLRAELQEAERRAQVAEEAAAAAKVAAEEQVAKADAARDEAAGLRDQVAALLKKRQAAEADAAAQLELEEKRQAELEGERSEVERRIQARIEERRKADEARAAQASGSRGSSSGTSTSKTSKSSKTSTSSSGSSGSSTFIRPVSGRLTSSYGQRFHPVLKRWKLHDGTDFGAACGTEIKAAASGTVSERYYNAGYGNRLMIDHGRIDGAYVTTGYNHATKYVVSVGEHVSQGQTIGYVGSTGYSTGCHLHLMVWEDGSVVNPMSNWFS